MTTRRHEGSGLELRDLKTIDECTRCAQLQEEIWGDGFREVVPPALLMVVQKVGGIVVGAFEEERLIGFVFGITGVSGGRIHHWSHMLGVRAECRDRGIGRRLKAYQRERVLALGVSCMSWTFDPLVARNAHLNINGLGARVMAYEPDYYGENPLSATDGIIGTDRFAVTWDMEVLGSGVGTVTGGTAPDVSLNATWDGARAVPRTCDLPDHSTVYVEIPEDIQALKLGNPHEAMMWRAQTRCCFMHYLALGYVVAGFARYDGPRWLYRVTRRGEPS